MASITRRGVIGHSTAFASSASLFGLLPEASDAAGPEDVLRTASMTLAKACLKPGDYKDFTQWLNRSQVIGNPMIDNGNDFHNRFSFPLLFTHVFEMRRTKDHEGYFGIKGLPQLSYADRFDTGMDLNAAEIAAVSDDFLKDGALAITVSGRQSVGERDRDLFFFSLGRKTSLRPVDVDQLYYTREFRIANSGQRVPGFGFSITGRPGVGRFLLT